MGDLGKMKTSVMAIWKHCGKDHSDCGDWCPGTVLPIVAM